MELVNRASSRMSHFYPIALITQFGEARTTFVMKLTTRLSAGRVTWVLTSVTVLLTVVSFAAISLSALSTCRALHHGRARWSGRRDRIFIG